MLDTPGIVKRIEALTKAEIRLTQERDEARALARGLVDDLGTDAMLELAEKYPWLMESE